jgi:hypothetical protein
VQDRLSTIAERILRREEERKQRGEEIRSSMEDFIHSIHSRPPTTTVGAVDGGIVHDEYGSMILLILRAVGAVFRYSDGSLEEVKYIPSPLPDPEVIDNDLPLEREDYHPFISLHRLREELHRALDVASLSPEFLFLDGSIVPQIVDKPHGKHLQNLYLSTVSLYRSFYSLYPSILPGGIVKDTRGNRLGLYLQEKGIDIPNWQDISWLSYVLHEGEYTEPIPYSEDPEKHATLKDIGEHAENIYIIYLRASPLDRPFRVEFYSEHPREDARRIAELLYPLSSRNPHYSIPPFMVEVDLRARPSKESLSYVK